jgi:hypothetical protein
VRQRTVPLSCLCNTLYTQRWRFPRCAGFPAKSWRSTKFRTALTACLYAQTPHAELFPEGKSRFFRVRANFFCSAIYKIQAQVGAACVWNLAVWSDRFAGVEFLQMINGNELPLEGCPHYSVAKPHVIVIGPWEHRETGLGKMKSL